jgi:ABC-type glycerol-3-phosphate transport system permease component
LLRLFVLAMIPVLLVALGIMVMTQRMGVAPTYPALVMAGVLAGGAIWLVRRRNRQGDKSA